MNSCIWAKLVLLCRALLGHVHPSRTKYRPEQHYMRGPGPAAHHKRSHER